MSSNSQVDGRALEEAWRWLSVMTKTPVSTNAVLEFFAWRRVPGNEEAYERVSEIYDSSGASASSAIVQQTLAGIDARAPASTTRPRLSRSLLGWGAAAACSAAVMIAVFALQTPWGGQTYATATGETRSIVLSDGTRLSLDTGTAVRVRYSAKARTVALLRGQALFDVVHMPSRPFLVDAGGAQIRDLGTRFDVRKDADSVRVTLLAGSAEVSSQSAPGKLWTLNPGEQISTGKVLLTPHTVDPAASTSWTDGHVMFDDTPLSSAIAEVNRYARHPVSLSDGRLGSLLISGTFNTGDTDAFVAAVSNLHSLKEERRPDGAIVLSALAPDNPT